MFQEFQSHSVHKNIGLLLFFVYCARPTVGSGTKKPTHKKEKNVDKAGFLYRNNAAVSF